MCGRYFLPEPDEDYPKLGVIVEELNRSPLPRGKKVSGEVRPSETAPVIVGQGEGYAVRLMGWGFPKPEGSGLVINCRSETADTLPLFSSAAQCCRCLIPAGGFYEWQRLSGDHKTKPKFSFILPESSGGELMYMAGLYAMCHGQERFVILTQAANPQLTPYHHRMPVIFRSPALKKRWLAGKASASYAQLRNQWETPRLVISPA